MCWGGRGLAASCFTSSSPMPRLDPVTRTLRASAVISAASVPGGDTRQDRRLLSMKTSQEQPGVWLRAPTGTGTVPAPALAPCLPQAEPGSQGGSRAPRHFGAWGCTSPALRSSPPLHSSKAPAPRVSVTAGEGSPLPQAWKSTWKHHQEAENRSKSGCGWRSPSLEGEFGMVEPRDANPKPSLGSAGRAFLTLQAQLVPMLSPRAPRSQQRRPPAPCSPDRSLLGLQACGHHPSSCWRTMLDALLAQEVPAKPRLLQPRPAAGHGIFRKQK